PTAAPTSTTASSAAATKSPTANTEPQPHPGGRDPNGPRPPARYAPLKPGGIGEERPLQPPRRGRGPGGGDQRCGAAGGSSGSPTTRRSCPPPWRSSPPRGPTPPR